MSRYDCWLLVGFGTGISGSDHISKRRVKIVPQGGTVEVLVLATGIPVLLAMVSSLVLSCRDFLYHVTFVYHL